MGFFNKRGRKSTMSDINIQDIKLTDSVFINNAAAETIKEAQEEKADVSSSERIRDITALQQDLSKMGTALRESMRLSQNSVGEIEKFANFLKIAEINTMSLERLQPENVELKAKLESVRNELAKKQLWASELESKSLAYKARFEETHEELESSQTRLADLDERIIDERTLRVGASGALDKIQEERRELCGMIDDLKAENQMLQGKISRLSESETALSRHKTELIKKAELLDAKIVDVRREREVAQTDLKALRLDFSELKSGHVETLSKLDKARHSAHANEQALSDFRQRSEDRIFALTSAIDGLKAQHKINEDMSRYDEQEKAKLKAEAEHESRQVKELKGRLEARAKEQEEGHAALSRAKANYDLLNVKYLTLLSDMEALRGEHKQQSQKLEEYSSISGVAVGQSFFDTGNRTKTRTKSSAKTSAKSRVAPKLQLVKDEPSPKK